MHARVHHPQLEGKVKKRPVASALRPWRGDPEVEALIGRAGTLKVQDSEHVTVIPHGVS